MAERIFLETPSKINLHLAVGPLRQDGYHPIESIFVPIDYGDSLEFTRQAQAGSWHLKSNLDISSEKNIVTRAVLDFRRASGEDFGLSCVLKKTSPPGAGLGSGSANAAYSLLALNKMAKEPLSFKALLKIAAGLGSDVPFFLYTCAAWVQGRGEIIQPLSLPQHWAFVLLMPGLHNNTAALFAQLDALRQSSNWKPTKEDQKVLANGEQAKYWLSQPFRCWPFYNDFQSVLLQEGEENKNIYRQMLADLYTAGAGFAAVSGSGSTCFGVFSGKKEAERAKNQLLTRWKSVYIANTLARPAIAGLQ